MVECESCSKWFHSKCVGITQSTAPSFPFVCPFCVKLLFSRLAAAELEIVALREQISTLESAAEQCQAHRAEIDRLSNSLHQVSLNRSSPSPPPKESDPHDATNINGNIVDSNPNPRRQLLHTRKEKEKEIDRRYNIVVLGVRESSQGVPFIGRINSDIEAVSTIIF